MPAIDPDGCRTPVPGHAGHLFRQMQTTDAREKGLTRTNMPGLNAAELSRLAALYNLKDYLFETVSGRFGRDGTLSPYDFFAIVIWKSNRPKTRIQRGNRGGLCRRPAHRRGGRLHPRPARGRPRSDGHAGGSATDRRALPPGRARHRAGGLHAWRGPAGLSGTGCAGAGWRLGVHGHPVSAGHARYRPMMDRWGGCDEVQFLAAPPAFYPPARV